MRISMGKTCYLDLKLDCSLFLVTLPFRWESKGRVIKSRTSLGFTFGFSFSYCLVSHQDRDSFLTVSYSGKTGVRSMRHYSNAVLKSHIQTTWWHLPNWCLCPHPNLSCILLTDWSLKASSAQGKQIKIEMTILMQLFGASTDFRAGAHMYY